MDCAFIIIYNADALFLLVIADIHSTDILARTFSKTSYSAYIFAGGTVEAEYLVGSCENINLSFHINDTLDIRDEAFLFGFKLYHVDVLEA